MATATATSLNRTEQAVQLRVEAAALEKVLSKLRADLQSAQEKLGAAETKRQKLVDATARGELVKAAVVATTEAEIDAAKIGVEAFAPTVASKSARLDVISAELQRFEQELSAEAAAAARKARFDELTKRGNDAADAIAGKLRAILEHDFVALDAVRDALVGEFVGGRYNIASGPEAQAARTLLHTLTGKLLAVDETTVAERTLLRQGGFTMRGDVTLTLRNLNPPRK